LPNTLEEAYDHTLEDIGKHNWEYAHRLLQFVAAASCPLRVEELVEFLAFDFDTDSTPILRDDWRKEDPAQTVRSTCSSLLSIVEVDGLSIIQFAHFSVKEYLTSNRLAGSKETISRFHVSMTLARTIIAQACLGVIFHIDEKITKDELDRFPLAVYAAKNWVDYAQFQDVLPTIQDEVKCLFDPNNHHVSVWVWLYDPDLKVRDRRSKRPSRARVTPLHYAAFCGLNDIVQLLIIERSQNVNALGFGEDMTPLGEASRKGYTEITRVLLEHRADTEITDNKGCSPLYRASENGHVEVVWVLLDHHADVNFRGGGDYTALHAASMSGQVAVARVLLANGADANAKTKVNKTPLHFACNKGVACVLLEYDADPNAHDKRDRTLLHRVLEDGSGEVSWVLLESGVDPNAQDNWNWTPLHVASEVGHLDGVRLLLQHGTDIHAWDNDDLTPFWPASISASVSKFPRKYQDVVQLLLEHGAEGHGEEDLEGAIATYSEPRALY